MPSSTPNRGTVNPDDRLILTPSMIPKSPNFDSKQSRYFKEFTNLPTPEEVRKQAEAQHLAGASPDNRRTFSNAGPQRRPPPVVFKEMGLLVKWGTAIKISEGQCLYAIGQLLKDYVPVPELYGWRQDGSESFIYMEHFDAQNLEEAWDTLGPDDRISVCDELRTICANLRYLEQDPEDLFVGNIVRAPLYDRAIHPDSMSEAGPFDTVKKFHDWFTFLYRKPMPDPYSVPIEPFRHDLPDDSAIIFTHGDLHRSNILITGSQPYRVVAVVDWEQSGWLPAYWEARKAHVSVSITGEWSKKYLQMIMCPFNGTREAWNYYTLATGC